MNKRSIGAVGLLCGLAVLVCFCPVRAHGGEFEKAAAEIMSASGVQGGLIVQLESNSGRLTQALRVNQRYVVQGLDGDPEDVAEARSFIRSATGAYGPVSVRQWDGGDLPYADNTVNLLVSEEPLTISLAEAMRVLAPRGVLCLRKDGRWTTKVKPRPKALDGWTHWRHGADANPVANDSVVGPPRHVQWVSEPRWQTHHDMVPSVCAMVSAGGRVFSIINEVTAGVRGMPGKWRLVARDAFNGVLLWKRKIPEWGWEEWSTHEMGRFNKPIHLARRLVADNDRVYATLGFNAPVTALDAATGETVRTYPGTKYTSEIVQKGNLLLLSVNQGPQGPGHVSDKPPVKKHVMAFECDTGRKLWETGDYVGVSSSWDDKERITRLALSAGEDRAFFLDDEDVVALDLESGEEIWRAARPEHPPVKAQFGYYYPNLCSLSYQEGVVLLAQPRPVKGHIPYTPVETDIVALQARTGKELWASDCYNWGYGSPPDIFVIDGLAWTHDAKPYSMIGLDLQTGQEKRRFSTEEGLRMTHHHRCYRNKATERYILTARRGVEFFDVSSGDNLIHHWVRGTCRLGIMPANGLLYAPPHPCVCYITSKLNGMYALAPKRNEPASKKPSKPRTMLVRGSAYKETEGEGTDPGTEWPTYRHDSMRSGATECTVPGDVNQLWSADIQGTPSSAVVAGERAFVASNGAHSVLAFGTATGRRLWEHAAGGRIDTPPTVYRGRVLFGSCDGWVYCLRAKDGALAWRLRVAPADRQVMDHGQLESAWPVHGSVLVHEGTAYVCAGRSSFLDGGVYLYAVNPVTGEVLQRHRIYSINPETNEMPHCELAYDMPPDKPGALSDVMLTDGQDVYLRHLRIDPSDISRHELAGGMDILSKAQRRIQSRKGPNNYKYIGKHPGRGPQLLSNSGLLDDSWFNQSYWTVGGTGHSRLLVFDSEMIYGLRAYKRTRRHARDTFVPDKGGYELFAMDRQKGKKKWSKRIPLRVRAMILAGDTLFAAGTPDEVPENDPWAALEGRGGAELRAFNAANGEEKTKMELSSPPVWNGMSCAGGKLYISSQNGSLLCCGSESSTMGKGKHE